MAREHGDLVAVIIQILEMLLDINTKVKCESRLYGSLDEDRCFVVGEADTSQSGAG